MNKNSNITQGLDLDPPIYDGKESINKYMKRVEIFKNKIVIDKYNIILEFINVWLGVQYTSLSDFKNIYEPNLIKKKAHNISIIKKYSDIFKSKFDIGICDDFEKNDKYIILLLMRVLKNINYTLLKKTYGTNIAYTIRK